MKDWEQGWQQAAASDTLKELGELTKEEYDYYINLPDEK